MKDLVVRTVVLVVQDGGDDDDHVFDLGHAGQEVGSYGGHRFVSEVAAREHMYHVAAINLTARHVHDAGSSFQLKVGDEVRPQLPGLGLDIHRVLSARQGQEDTVLSGLLHFRPDTREVRGLQTHSLADAQGGHLRHGVMR